jgi:hypothetical protein
MNHPDWSDDEEPGVKRRKRRGRPAVVLPQLLAHYINHHTDGDPRCLHTTAETAEMTALDSARVSTGRTVLETAGYILTEEGPYRPAGRRQIEVALNPNFSNFLIRNRKYTEKRMLKKRENTFLEVTEIKTFLTYWEQQYQRCYQRPCSITGKDRGQAKHVVAFAAMPTLKRMVRFFFAPRAGGFRDAGAGVGNFYVQRYEILQRVEEEKHERKLTADDDYVFTPQEPKPMKVTWKVGK